MNYTFRDCADGDREWAYALKSEVYREVVERQFGPWDEEFQQRSFAQRWNPGISRVVVIDGAPVGLVAFERKSDHMLLDEIQVAALWRNRGIGTSILHDLLRIAKAEGMPIRLEVLKQNHRALALYRRLSFSLVGESGTHFCLQNGHETGTKSA